MKSNNKSQFQFNWIFVIVAGAIILTFFINFTVKYIDLKNKEDNAVIASTVDNILLELQQSSYTLEEDIVLEPVLYKLSCKDLEVGNFVSRSLSDRFVFGPSQMQTATLVLYMQRWNYPFKIANFFYLSDKRAYFLVYDSDSQAFVKSLDLPKKMNMQATQSMPTQKGKTVVFSKTYSSSNEVTIVQKDNSYEEGDVYIKGTKYPLFGVPFVYAAIFSDNYPCLLDRTLEEYKFLLKIYEGKATLLVQLRPDCNYDLLVKRLQDLESYVTTKNYDQIKIKSKLLEEQNKNLNPSCPVLF